MDVLIAAWMQYAYFRTEKEPFNGRDLELLKHGIRRYIQAPAELENRFPRFWRNLIEAFP